MTHPAPIEIVGGGLAGLSLGLALIRSGIPVTLHEAGEYPRHRVCGEFITGLASGTIARLGLQPMLAGALQHQEVAWFINQESARIQRLPLPALGLSRYLLDARLADAFVAAGGDLRTRSRVTVLATKPGRVFATGRNRAQSSWLGLKIHTRGLPLTRNLELHLGTEAYVGLSAVEEGAVNVCGLFRQRSTRGQGPALLLAYMRGAGLHGLAERLAAAEWDENSFSAVAALGFDRRTTERNRVCLGDACAMIPPFTGNGMAMAFQSAELALDPLLAYARSGKGWSDTCRTVDTALRSRFRLRLASASVLHPFLLEPRRQRWLAALNRARLLPFHALYAALH